MNAVSVRTQYVDRAPEADAKALSLASGDLDEDGVPDLLAGFSQARGGLVAVHLGNIASLFPRNSTDWMEPVPFREQARTFPSPEDPDFLGVGDFDADGHLDVVIAAEGSGRLYWLPGDGRGGLAAARAVDLEGSLTALVVGEINRADGLADVIVATEEPAEILIFESYRGAFRDEPEAIAASASVSALVLGQFDADYPYDLAAGEGAGVSVVYGRDRKLSRGGEEARSVPPPRIERLTVASPIVSMAAGRFLSEGGRTDLAILGEDGILRLLRADRAEGRPDKLMETGTGTVIAPPSQVLDAKLHRVKLSALAGEDLILTSRSNPGLQVLLDEGRSGAYSPRTLEVGGAPIVALPMRLTPDGLDDLVVLEAGRTEPSVLPTAPLLTLTVNAAGDEPDAAPGDFLCATAGGVCTLRAAIQESNASPGADAIVFSLGAGTPTIAPLLPLPVITETLTILGNTGGATRVELDGSGAGGPIVFGLTLGTPSSGSLNSVVRSLVINRFSHNGIEVESSGNFIEDCYLGTDSTGNFSVPGNALYGVGTRRWTTGNIIGGSASAQRNVISNNSSSGVSLEGTGEYVIGNYIGTDATGLVGSSVQGVGVLVWQASTVGGSTPTPGTGSGNVISGDELGVLASGTGVIVQGNLIGLTANGAAPLPNAHFGVDCGGNASSGSVTVGGTTVPLRNVISGNGISAVILRSNDNIIQGNYIGTDISGTAAIPNSNLGVDTQGTPSLTANNNLIGGLTATPGTPPGNVISGNIDGIRILGSYSTGSVVRGNLIGTDRSGMTPLPNLDDGIEIAISPANMVESNVISGNGNAGISVLGSNNNDIRSNFIGTNIMGSAALPNHSGIKIIAGSGHELEANVISANTHGIVIQNSTGNLLLFNNLVGTDASGTAALGNQAHGVWIDGGGQNVVGSPFGGPRNIISGNGFDGIRIVSSSSNVVSNNYIGLGADGLILPNGGDGIRIEGYSSSNTIGSPLAGAPRNEIVGNGGNGVWLRGAGVTANAVLTNRIAENGTHGVLVDEGASGNTVGNFACAPSCNVITSNTFDGVAISGATTMRNAIHGNQVDSNGGLGIDIDPPGVTPNDTGDGDGGANMLQNFPVLVSAIFNGTNTLVQGSIDSTANTGFTVELFGNASADPTTHGEGAIWLGSTGCTTDAAGNCSFSHTVSGGHRFITATATDPAGNTSEFSQVFSNVLEAGVSPQLTVRKLGAGFLGVSYGPACGATGHGIYVGTGPIAGSLSWTQGFCSSGASGTAVIRPVGPPTGGFLYFVIVGQNPTREGSYGTDSTGLERPEAPAVGTCDRPQVVSTSCP